MKKCLLPILTLCGMIVISHASLGATNASDNAANPVYSGGAYAGLNGGSGFLAWTVTGGNNGNTSAFNGSYVGGTGLNSNASNAFGLYAGDVNTGAFANAVRPFNGTLTIGQTFSVDIGHTTVGTNGLVGLSLQNSAGTTEINLQTAGTSWMLNTGAGNVTIATDANNTPFHFTLTYNGGSSYSYTFTGSAGGSNLTATNTISAISQANFFDFQQGSNQNLGFNNLAIVPEPGTWAMMAVGSLGGWALIRRRQSSAR